MELSLSKQCQSPSLYRWNIFSFSHRVFYPFRELSIIFFKFKIVVCNFFKIGRAQNMLFKKRFDSYHRTKIMFPSWLNNPGFHDHVQSLKNPLIRSSLLGKTWSGQVDYPSLSNCRTSAKCRRTSKNSEILWTLMYQKASENIVGKGENAVKILV